MLSAMPHTIDDLLHRAATRFGHRRFLGVGGESCTFGEFAGRVEAAARQLVSAGVQPNDRVVVLLPRTVEEAVYLLAAMRVQAIAVPVHGKLKDAQVRHVLDDCTPRCVVTSGSRTLALRDPDDVLRGQTLIDTGNAENDYQPDRHAASSAVSSAASSAGDAAVMLYTSGSTGQAKGIVQTHRNLVRGAEIVSDYLGLAAEDHILALLSFSFDYGLNQLLSALHVGCRLTAADHLGAAELAGLLETHRPTGMAFVPSLWHEVAQGLQSGVLHEGHGKSLRYLTNSGGALPAADTSVIRARWPGVDVFAMYGLTEAFRSAFLPPDQYDAHPDSFGRALDGVELLLVDPVDGRVLEGAATGELVHAGDLVSAGYWRRPDADAERFRPDPRPGRQGETVVYSGDLVRRDEAGLHYFVARRDRMLKVHGHRVSPDEVALAVRGVDGIGAVHVFGADGGAIGHHIVMCLTGDGADPDLLATVRRRSRARLPSYMQPQTIRVLPRLPLNANGKVDEAALRTLCQESGEPG